MCFSKSCVFLVFYLKQHAVGKGSNFFLNFVFECLNFGTTQRKGDVRNLLLFKNFVIVIFLLFEISVSLEHCYVEIIQKMSGKIKSKDLEFFGF